MLGGDSDDPYNIFQSTFENLDPQDKIECCRPLKSIDTTQFEQDVQSIKQMLK